ncbi:MAG: guanylate kinase, partial [Candidatus Aminicenantes bacterium]|nr:guanylate kinase [Candidatus Aminicenantes bacterium]
MLFIVTGPSGCGKSSLAGRILEEIADIEFSVSYTTRKERDTEKEGKDYYFVSNEEFERMIKEKKFIEWAVVHGHYYGTSRREIEKKGIHKDLILDIDVQGAQKLRSEIKKAVFIFILPPSYQELKNRLIKRGQESIDSIENRLEVAKKEIRYYSQFDYIVLNDKFEEAVVYLKSIILSTRCRRDIQIKNILP